MQDQSGLPRHTGINTVEDLNEVLNDLWHTLGVEHDYAVWIMEELLHPRVCDLKDPSCWKCQMRYAHNMGTLIADGQLCRCELEGCESANLEPHAVHWLNSCINENLRAARVGRPVPHSDGQLKKIHAELDDKHYAKTMCIFCLAKANAECDWFMPTDQRQLMEQSGFRPLIQFSPAELEEIEES
jgi:hypothetical protein